MKTVWLTFIVLLLTIGASAQREKSGLLPPEEAKIAAKQCSRPSPSDFTDTWEPSKEEIRAMEAKLSDISKLRVKKCCVKGVSIKNPNDWYMQYAALVWHGKKIIYISALSEDPPQDYVVETVDGDQLLSRKTYDFKVHAVIVCDGGYNWGVIYDPSTGKFSDLAVNGIA